MTFMVLPCNAGLRRRYLWVGLCSRLLAARCVVCLPLQHDFAAFAFLQPDFAPSVPLQHDFVAFAFWQPVFLDV